MANYGVPHTFPMDPATPAVLFDDLTTPGPFPPADLDALSPFPNPAVGGVSHTPHPATSGIDATFDVLTSTFTPFHSAEDPDFASHSVPDLTLPVTIAPPALLPELEPARPRKNSPAPVPIPLAPAASPVTPAVPVRSPAVGRKPIARGRRGKSRRTQPKEEKIELPPEWEKIRETLSTTRDDVPDEVVDALFKEVRGKAEEAAKQEKLKLREELKNNADGQQGSSAEISSRREARVSRKFQEQLKEGVEVQLKVMVTRYCQLWRSCEKLKADLKDCKDSASRRKEETDVIGLGDFQERLIKRQRMD